jgi:hypothetical protein
VTWGVKESHQIRKSFTEQVKEDTSCHQHRLQETVVRACIHRNYIMVKLRSDLKLKYLGLTFYR